MKRKIEILVGTVLVGLGGGVAELHSFEGNHLPVLIGMITLATGARISEAGVSVESLERKVEKAKNVDISPAKLLLSAAGLAVLTQGSVFVGTGIVAAEIFKILGGATMLFLGFVALHYSLKDTPV